MLNKTLPLIGIFFLFIILATAGLATAAPSTKAADASAQDPPLTMSIIFANGHNTTTATVGSNITVSVDIANVAKNSTVQGIDFYSVGIVWTPAYLELRHNNTATDLVAGTFMTSFADVASDETFLSKGELDGVSGFDLSTNSSGSGTLFNITFTCKAVGTGRIGITAINGLYTYVSSDGMSLTINAGYNATLTITVPEFPASAVLPIFLIVTTGAIAAATVSARKRRTLPMASQHQ